MPSASRSIPSAAISSPLPRPTQGRLLEPATLDIPRDLSAGAGAHDTLGRRFAAPRSGFRHHGDGSRGAVLPGSLSAVLAVLWQLCLWGTATVGDAPQPVLAIA